MKGQEGMEGQARPLQGAVKQGQHCPPQKEHHVTCHVPPGASHVTGICHMPQFRASHVTGHVTCCQAGHTTSHRDE